MVNFNSLETTVHYMYITCHCSLADNSTTKPLIINVKRKSNPLPLLLARNHLCVLGGARCCNGEVNLLCVAYSTSSPHQVERTRAVHYAIGEWETVAAVVPRVVEVNYMYVGSLKSTTLICV